MLQGDPCKLRGEVGGVGGDEVEPLLLVDLRDVALGVHALDMAHLLELGQDLIKVQIEEMRVVLVSRKEPVVDGKPA